MSREDIYKKLKEIFEDVFDTDNIKLDDLTSSNDIDGWDSLTHITLIGVIEDEFGIRFGVDEISGMKNVGQMADSIQRLV